MSSDVQDTKPSVAMPEFTPEERNYIFAFAADDGRDGALYRSLSGAAYYLPSVAIGGYGLWDGSFKMLGIGFLTLIVSLGWGFFTEWRGGGYHERMGRSIVTKLRRAMDETSVR